MKQVQCQERPKQLAHVSSSFRLVLLSSAHTPLNSNSLQSHGNTLAKCLTIVVTAARDEAAFARSVQKTNDADLIAPRGVGHRGRDHGADRDPREKDGGASHSNPAFSEPSCARLLCRVALLVSSVMFAAFIWLGVTRMPVFQSPIF
jgi:hypothetical protein